MKIDHEQPVPGCAPKPNPTTSHGITEAYTLTDEDKRILAKARRALQNQRTHGAAATGPTADDILTEHGVTIRAESARWHAILRALMGADE